MLSFSFFSRLKVESNAIELVEFDNLLIRCTKRGIVYANENGLLFSGDATFASWVTSVTLYDIHDEKLRGFSFCGHSQFSHILLYLSITQNRWLEYFASKGVRSCSLGYHFCEWVVDASKGDRSCRYICCKNLRSGNLPLGLMFLALLVLFFQLSRFEPYIESLHLDEPS